MQYSVKPWTHTNHYNLHHMRIVLAIVAVVSLAVNGVLAYKLFFVPLGPSVVVQQAAKRIVMRKPGGLLEVSTIAAEERFESSTSHTILGVPVGKTVAMVKVPAVYRYHIPLAKDWVFRVDDGTLLVIAPPVQPSLPVAIDTTRIETFSEGAWSLLTGQNAINRLVESITPALGKKASTADLLLLQRESARLTVSEFVRKWVTVQDQWKGKKIPTVIVVFEDEPLGKTAAPLMAVDQ